MFTPNLGLIILFVDNPSTSAAFYKRILSIQPIEESPTFVLFALPNEIMLGLWSRHTAKPEVTAQPGATEICFITSEVDTTHAAWQQLGVNFAQAPIDMEGGRAFVALDPDGHRIRVINMKEEA